MIISPGYSCTRIHSEHILNLCQEDKKGLRNFSSASKRQNTVMHNSGADDDNAFGKRLYLYKKTDVHNLVSQTWVRALTYNMLFLIVLPITEILRSYIKQLEHDVRDDDSS